MSTWPSFAPTTQATTIDAVDHAASGVSEKKGTRGRPVAPTLVRFFAGRSQSFVQFGGSWRRMRPEDEAHSHTGYHRETRELSIGVSIMRRPNGLVRVAFDLWKLDVNLRPAAIESLERRWREQAATLLKSLQRSTARRAHFSKSFASFEIPPARSEEWKDVLEAVLSNPDSYESVERLVEATP
jgi:hypothetical protein